MADYLTTDTELTSIANAIRTKGGTSASLVYPTGFVSAIEAIPIGETLPDATGEEFGTVISTITFTYEGITYTAEDGMNWYDWCRSAYNTIGLLCTDSNGYVYDSYYLVQLAASPYTYQEGQMTIINNGIYQYDPEPA